MILGTLVLFRVKMFRIYVYIIFWHWNRIFLLVSIPYWFQTKHPVLWLFPSVAVCGAYNMSACWIYKVFVFNCFVCGDICQITKLRALTRDLWKWHLIIGQYKLMVLLINRFYTKLIATRILNDLKLTANLVPWKYLMALWLFTMGKAMKNAIYHGIYQIGTVSKINLWIRQKFKLHKNGLK